jgi:isopenicillin-N N-acyltransferase-like protein
VGELSFPRIRVEGGPAERGQQYGAQAASRIKRGIEIYQEIFEHYAGWDWAKVVKHAHSFEPVFESYRSHFLTEMRGIAEGAGVSLGDILALNVRTEVMFAGVARAAAKECTAFVALPEVTKDRHTLIGQNWDWKPATSETLVILEVEPEKGPRFVTVVEAGMLAKIGFNSAGIGLTTNALVSDHDKGLPAVPYHAVLRAVLESETPAAALLAITYHRRSSSANYLIGHRDGEAINVETAPGDYSRVYVQFPEGEVYGHANHFASPGFGLKDVGMWEGPGSLFRAHRVKKLLERSAGEVTVEVSQKVLTDHFSNPSSICSHTDPKLSPVEQFATITSVIMDLDTREMWVTNGNPCQTPYHHLDYGSLLA